MNIIHIDRSFEEDEQADVGQSRRPRHQRDDSASHDVDVRATHDVRTANGVQVLAQGGQEQVGHDREVGESRDVILKVCRSIT